MMGTERRKRKKVEWQRESWHCQLKIDLHNFKSAPASIFSRKSPSLVYMAMLPKVVHKQATFNFELVRVADWKREGTKIRGNIMRQMDTNTHSHTMITDHTKWSLQRSLMQVALSIFSPTSARGKNKRHLIPLWSHWELPSPRQPVRQPANLPAGGCSMGRRTRCLTTSSLGSAGGLQLSEDVTPCSALWRCACSAEALPSCTSYPLLP